MKEIVLEKLSLKNFKGIFNREIEFSKRTDIYGTNETGKSTLLAAYIWLLTGKDQFDRTDYEIKNTVNTDLNRQPHEVEGTFKVGDKRITLKRVYLEKWERKSGSKEAVFTGHKTEYYVNDVPCRTAAEYNEEVAAIIPPKVFKMLSNPEYFLNMKWTDQRAILVDMAGEISVKDILSKIEDSDHLVEALENTTIEKYQAELNAKINALQKSAKEYPVRIEEVQHNMPESKDFDAIEDKISSLQQNVVELDNKILSISERLKEKREEIKEKNNKLSDLEIKLQGRKQEIKQELTQDINVKEQELNTLSKISIPLKQSEITKNRAAAKNIEDSIKALNKEIEQKNHEVAALREKWNEINAMTLDESENDFICPSCKQILPTDDIEAKKAEILENFNQNKIKAKADVVKKSEYVKAEIADRRERLNSYTKDLEELENSYNFLKAELDSMLLREGELREEVGMALSKIAADILQIIEEDAEVQELEKQIEYTQKELEELFASEEQGTSELQEQRDSLNREIDYLKKELRDKEIIENSKKRIKELQREWDAILEESLALEKKKYDCEQYVSLFMACVQDSVNNKFNHVRFDLFEKQVNGAIVDACVCTYKGVPVNTVNTGGRLIAGIDIINALSKHYGYSIPVFIDNKESSVYIPECNSQVITLSVSENDKEIRIVNN